MVAAAPNVALGFCTDTVADKYADAAHALFNEGVLKGNPDGSCTLDQGINRIEFAVMAMRKSGGDEAAQATSFQPGLFKDLKDQNVWFANYAATAKARGILKGDGAGNLRATDPVNAAEAAVIAVRAAELQMPAATGGQAWYQPTFDILNANRVKVFSADYKMTRGDVVVLLNQIDMNHTDISNAIDSYSPSTSTAGMAGVSPVVKLMAEFDTLSSEEGNKIYDLLTADQKSSLEALSPNFSVVLLLGLCEANPSRTIPTPAGMMGCDQGNQFLKNLENSDDSVKSSFQAGLESEMVAVLIRELCIAKAYQDQINESTCADFLPGADAYISQYFATKSGGSATSVPTDYTGTQGGDEYYNGVKMPKTAEEKESFNDFIDIMSDMQRSSHNTSMSIINNMGSGNCYVGIDDNCY